MIKVKYPTKNEYRLEQIKKNSGVLECYINDKFHGIICMTDIINFIDTHKK